MSTLFIASGQKAEPWVARSTSALRVPHPIYVEITASTAGAEVPLPQDAAQSVEDAFLAAANATATVGRDVIPQSFTGVVFDAVRDPVSNQTAFTDVVVGMSLSALGPFLEVPIPIDLRSIADYDSTQTTIVIVP